MTTEIDLALVNAQMITMDGPLSGLGWITINDGRITGIGRGELPTQIARTVKNYINCEGNTLIPGFHDAHCHVLSGSTSLLAVDCSPSNVSSISGIQNLLIERKSKSGSNNWIRAFGYNEFYLDEKRHPNRWDLDQAVPDRPVKLLHRSGHATVLNSTALNLVNINRNTPDPVYGVIDRHPETGDPTGLLLEMGRYLDSVIPVHPRDELEDALTLFNQRSLSLGITSLQDATASNGIEQWRLFSDLSDLGRITPSLTLMPGLENLSGFLDQGLSFGYQSGNLRVGAAKLIINLTTGDMQPTPKQLLELIKYANQTGFQVAIHAVESESVRAAITAIQQAGTECISNTRRHRIEHCSECPTDLMYEIVKSGISVVTQPGIIYYHGQRYLAETEVTRIPWLYRIGSLHESKATIAAGSDCPVIEPNPLIGIYAAVSRLANSGDVVLPSEAISPHSALKMYTLGSATVNFQENEKGSITVGKIADLALLDDNPILSKTEHIPNIKVMMTIVRGEVAWRHESFIPFVD